MAIIGLAARNTEMTVGVRIQSPGDDPTVLGGSCGGGILGLLSGDRGDPRSGKIVPSVGPESSH